METAVFSAASLFHGADDSDDDDRGMTIKPTPTPTSLAASPPLRRAPRAPNRWCFLLVCGVEDEMQVSAEGTKPAALEYEERTHDFPGMVWFHDSAAALVLLRDPERLGPCLLAFSTSRVSD